MSNPTPAPAGPAGAAADGFHVNPQVLVQGAVRLRAESEELLYELASTMSIQMNACGSDPISKPALDGFQAKIKPIVNQTTVYAQNLAAIASQLHDQATSYGATDAQFQQAFDALNQDKSPGAPILASPTPGDPMGTLAQKYPPQHPTGDLRPMANPPASSSNPFIDGIGRPPR
jgi:hypothetical protein